MKDSIKSFLKKSNRLISILKKGASKLALRERLCSLSLEGKSVAVRSVFTMAVFTVLLPVTLLVCNTIDSLAYAEENNLGEVRALFPETASISPLPDMTIEYEIIQVNLPPLSGRQQDEVEVVWTDNATINLNSASNYSQPETQEHFEEPDLLAFSFVQGEIPSNLLETAYSEPDETEMPSIAAPDSLQDIQDIGGPFSAELSDTEEHEHSQPENSADALSRGYIWPTAGNITSRFGPRRSFAGSNNHKGVDIAGKHGQLIVAAHHGEVIFSGRNSSFGLHIKILHENGDITLYAHCSELLVIEGDRVHQGEEIALMGRTGTATGVHLHFEVIISGSNVDPLLYLEAVSG